VDLELAAIARSRVDMTHGERAAETLERQRLEALRKRAQRRIGRARRLGDDPRVHHAKYDLVHQRSAPE
jgi:hypothetical protein